jgi:hypothetical protein
LTSAFHVGEIEDNASVLDIDLDPRIRIVEARRTKGLRVVRGKLDTSPHRGPIALGLWMSASALQPPCQARFALVPAGSWTSDLVSLTTVVDF